MKKNIRRIISLFAVSLCLLTSCGVAKNDGSGSSLKADSQRLNISQADLIAQITDNEKYLNPNLLYDVKGLDDSDKIGVIVTLDSDGVADSYFTNSRGYKSVGDYALSGAGAEEADAMIRNQKALADFLLKKGLIEEINHSYTTLFNGFSAQTTYGQYKQLLKLNLAEKISISEVYAAPQSVSTGQTAVENVVDVYETGIFNSSNVDYDGENTAVAILDSGFDVHHTVFQTMPQNPMITKSDVREVLSQTKASTFTSGLKAEDVYVNTKIPYAYDYADKDSDVTPFDSEHGTHVAGIIGGSDDTITGVAVNTQLVLLKVFGDLVSGAKTEDILAALEDAVVLKVDAINMSLGTSCGFSRLEDDEYLNSVYDKIEAAGISLVIAASNDYSSAYGGDEGNTNKASNPDSATVGSPSTYTASLSVASISGTKSKYIVADDGYVFFFNEANNAGSKPYDFYEMLNLPNQQNVTYEYVTVPGNGKEVNYSNIDVKGKIALVKRGENSFEDKAKIAYEAGAVACIVYNNIGGDILMSAGNNLKIPFCSISKDDGEYLASKVSGTLTFNTDNLAGPFMSDFSSWGPNPDLKLKPEITAHGGNITSSVPGGGYDQLSGTSMASPNMCGIVVLIRQYLKEKFPTYSAPEISAMTNELLMSCATIALDSAGNPYSPRKQGAGLASLYNAVNTNAYLTVDGIDKAKLELGDDPQETGVYTLKFNLNNLSGKSLSYALTNYTMTESLSTSDKDYVAEKAYMLNPSTQIKVTGNGSLSGDVITVNAGGSVQIEYTLTLSEAEKRYIRKSFSNGMYVEGFAALQSKNADGIDLSIPFLAFFGDWTVAPMFDKTFYEVETEAHNSAIDDEDKLKADYYATTPLGTYYYNYIIPLGSYVYTMDTNAYDPIPATEEHAAMGYSYDTINGITCVYAGLLRNAEKMTTTITNTVTGEVVYEHINYNQLKAHYSGGQIPSYDLLDLSIEELGLANNTNYTFTMKGELAYGDGGIDTNLNNTFSFTFYVDFEAPILTDTQFYAKYDKTLKENRYYLDVYVYDNHYTQSVRPFTLIDGSLVSLCEYPTPVYGERGTVSKVTMEITDYMDLLKYSTGSSGTTGLTNGLGIMIDDYAMNSSYYYVSFPGTNADSYTFVDTQGNPITSYTTEVGTEVDLSKMLTSNDVDFRGDDTAQAEYMAKLSWKSSDESIVRVQNGKIEGIAPGTAVVTASGIANDGYTYQTSITIVVNAKTQKTSYRKLSFSNSVALEEINFVYYDTLKAFIAGPEYSEIGETGDRSFFTGSPAISFYPSEKVQLGYEITPWNLDSSRYTLAWSSTNPSVASVDENGVVTALKKGNATVMLRITVDGKLSNLIARARITVKDEFIVEGRTLTGYKGFGGDVVIPDDLGIMYIGAYAFSLYTTDSSIKVDEDDWDANKTVGGNDTITSVVIPADVTEIQKYAFYNCPNLETVTFLKDAKGETCKAIKEYAFTGDTSLKNINSENIQIIGAHAFDGCTALEQFDFSKIYALGEQAFKGCTGLTSVNLTTLRNAWPEVFMDCTNLTGFISGRFTKLSEGMFKNTGLTEVSLYVDRIPASAFADCKSLVKVDMVYDIVYVGEEAFSGCSRLSNVSFTRGCDYIYANAFKGNTSLVSLALPNGPVLLEQYAFFGCTKLSKLIFNTHTEITDNLGVAFEGCTALTSFVVAEDNPFYKTNGNLLTDKAETTVILAAPGYSYGNYTLPEHITAVADGAFSGIATLKTLKLTNVENIGKYAFAECTALTSVAFPANDVVLMEGAFEACTKLQSLENIQYITSIAPYSFASTALTSIQLGDNTEVGEGAFGRNTALKVVNLGTQTSLGFGAFIGCTQLTQVNIPADGRLLVGPYAFYGCTKLVNIDLSKVHDTIGEYAFYACQALKAANLTNVKHIDDFAFADCSNLTTLSVPMIETIGDAAFGAVSESSVSGGAFTTVEFPQTLRYIGEAAFYTCINLKSIILPADVEIEGFAFAYCTSLQSVTLGESMTVLPQYIFYKDTALISINTGNIEIVEEGAFYGCTHLKNVDLTNAKEIQAEAFYSCSSLTEVNLPKVTVLGDAAFLGAEGVVSLSIPQAEYIGEQALSVIGVGTIALPATLSYVAPTAFYGNESMTGFVYTDGDSVVDTYKINEYARIIQGALYTTTQNGKQVLSAYPSGKTDSVFTVAENTVRIEIYAAAKNPYIKTLILPDTLKLIGNMAFFDCTSLETVEFRSTVAPVLEGTPAGSQSDYTYEEGSPVYNLFNQYFQFNGYYPLYYGQFKAMVGTIPPMHIILPANSGLEGYDNTIYGLYFDMENMEISNVVSKDKNTINYLDKIALVPTEDITLKDETTVVEARTAYNSLKQNLLDFGYSQQEIDAMKEKLLSAESVIYELKLASIQKKYRVVIQDINDLGSEFHVSKIEAYADIMEQLREIDSAEKTYINTECLDEFKEGYDAYLEALAKDIAILDEISELPSAEVSVSKTAAVAVLIQNFLSCLALFGLGKHWFF